MENVSKKIDKIVEQEWDNFKLPSNITVSDEDFISLVKWCLQNGGIPYASSCGFVMVAPKDRTILDKLAGTLN